MIVATFCLNRMNSRTNQYSTFTVTFSISRKYPKLPTIYAIIYVKMLFRLGINLITKYHSRGMDRDSNDSCALNQRLRTIATAFSIT